MLTEEWRIEALRRFPTLAERLQDAETPYLLWFELRDAFECAYRTPRNEDMIKNIYGYSEWCFSQPAGKTADDDLATCVSVCFIEHIPEIPAAVEDMPRWFTRANILEMKEILSYHAGADGYKKILVCFNHYHKDKKKQKRK